MHTAIALTPYAIPFTLARQKKNKHAELLAAFEEAKSVARDPDAPTCTDLRKLDEFLLANTGTHSDLGL